MFTNLFNVYYINEKWFYFMIYLFISILIILFIMYYDFFISFFVVTKENNRELQNQKINSHVQNNIHKQIIPSTNITNKNIQTIYENIKPKYRYVSFLISQNSNKPLGSLDIELFIDDLPRTCLNFITIAQKGFYNGTPFHRVIKDFMIQGGDFINKNGTGSYNIFYKDKPFEDENFLYSHSSPGLLSMANSGKNTNGCQFFITLAPCLHLDNKHVIFGKLINKSSFDLLRFIGDTKTDQNDHPINDFYIVDTMLKENIDEPSSLNESNTNEYEDSMNYDKNSNEIIKNNSRNFKSDYENLNNESFQDTNDNDIVTYDLPTLDEI